MAREERQPEVHLWRLDCGTLSEVRDARTWLSQAEVAQAEARRAGRERFVFFRGALRRILGEYLGVDPAEVPLDAGVHRKPRVPAREGGSELHFNLAHSEDQGLIAVCRTAAVGVDLEVVRPVRDADRLVSRFFSPAEQAAYGRLPPDHRTLAFLRCWTRKEAYLKATGEGLSFPLERFSVTLSPGEPARLVEVDGDTEAYRQWHLQDCDPAAGCMAALAVAAPAARIVWRTKEDGGP